MGKEKEKKADEDTKVEEAVAEEQIQKEKGIFKGVIIVMIGFVLLFLAVYALVYSSKHFSYNGITAEAVKEGTLTFYKISMPVTYNGKLADYNFYLRKSPWVLSKIPFKGTVLVKKDMVIDMTEDFKCDGDGIIAIANLLKLYNVIGTSVIKDENASCDPAGRYMFVKITKGNETRIDQFGPVCYKISVKDCEILEGTERFMLETFAELKSRLKE
jgi:hypothetical protein